MSHKQVECQTERIELFLHQQLSGNEQADFERHLDDCDECCRRLEQSAAAEDVWTSIRESLHEEGLSLDSEDCSGGSMDSATSEAGPPFNVESVLQLLAPTDDDRMLGRLGTYEVMGIIGTGGMGVVLKALDPALNRYVAIKILSPHLGNSGAARKRFSREAQAAAAVVHDNVIEIHGVADANGLPYLVMPYVRGPSLQRRLDDDGPLSVVETLRIAKQAAAGLAAAHAQGLVHRDVKPANILLADGIERVKLTDFGLARAADDASLTKTGVIAGTPQYMSPEQACGDSVDQRSDLFSLGSVMYTMCTGRPPFRAETSYGILRRITDTEPRPIREINPDIPEWLCAIIGKLMSKRPEDRLTSAEQVAELLEECLAHVQQPTAVPLPQCYLSLRESSKTDQPARVSGRFAPTRNKPWASAQRLMRSPYFKLIAAAAFAFFLLLAGILIVLETNKGTLTIESEADNVPIKITQGDKVVEELSVSKSGRSVRIAAGKYVVEIEGETNELTVENGTVELQRRGKRLVKIIRASGAEEVASSERARSLFARTYAIADLVIPEPKPGADDAPNAWLAEFDSLIELITSTVTPDSWKNAGGPASIRVSPTNLSLVIVQTAQAHEQIEDLLFAFRKRVTEQGQEGEQVPAAVDDALVEGDVGHQEPPWSRELPLEYRHLLEELNGANEWLEVVEELYRRGEAREDELKQAKQQAELLARTYQPFSSFEKLYRQRYDLKREIQNWAEDLKQARRNYDPAAKDATKNTMLIKITDLESNLRNVHSKLAEIEIEISRLRRQLEIEYAEKDAAKPVKSDTKVPNPESLSRLFLDCQQRRDYHTLVSLMDDALVNSLCERWMAEVIDVLTSKSADQDFKFYSELEAVFASSLGNSDVIAVIENALKKFPRDNQAKDNERSAEAELAAGIKDRRQFLRDSLSWFRRHTEQSWLNSRPTRLFVDGDHASIIFDKANFALIAHKQSGGWRITNLWSSSKPATIQDLLDNWPPELPRKDDDATGVDLLAAGDATVGKEKVPGQENGSGNVSGTVESSEADEPLVYMKCQLALVHAGRRPGERRELRVLTLNGRPATASVSFGDGQSIELTATPTLRPISAKVGVPPKPLDDSNAAESRIIERIGVKAKDQSGIFVIDCQFIYRNLNLPPDDGGRKVLSDLQIRTLPGKEASISAPQGEGENVKLSITPTLFAVDQIDGRHLEELLRKGKTSGTMRKSDYGIVLADDNTAERFNRESTGDSTRMGDPKLDRERAKQELLRKAHLSKLAMAYHAFNAKHGRPPSGVKQFYGFVPRRLLNDSVTRAAFDRLRDGELVLTWNAKLSSSGEINDEYLLGHEKGVSETGGYVVTAGGFVKRVTAGEFARLPKIGTLSPKEKN